MSCESSQPAFDPRTVDSHQLGGFHRLLGYRQLEWREGYAAIALELLPEHLNLGGVVHGGVITALLDVVCAEAGTYCPYPGRRRKAITLTLNTSFTGQCSGGTLRAVASCKAAGLRIFNCLGEVFDEQGNLLAMGTATMRLRSGSEHPYGVPLHEKAVHPASG